MQYEDMYKGVMYTVSKLPAKFEAQQVKTPRIVHTTEGPREARTGDYIVRDVIGNYYPIHAENFSNMYVIESFMRYDESIEPQESIMQVTNIPSERFAILADREMKVINSNGETLNAVAGEVVVRYKDGDYGVVKPDIFKATYQILRKSDLNDRIKAADLYDVFTRKD